MSARPASPLPEWAADILATLPPLLTREEAAAALRMHTSTVDRRIVAGDLVAIVDGGKVAIPRLELVRMLVAKATARSA